MDQVLTFDKSFHQRLQEYKDVLGFGILPVTQIQKEWGLYLELVLDPNGWQAVWKIPRALCESFKIEFPSVVLVFVLDVDYKNLVASVQVIAVQDDIHLPEKHYVPLIQLWPMKDQDKSIALNIQSTANAMDLLRFFYMNIFMPWDYEDDDTSDWLPKHLETRLRLYYDMKNGMIPRGMAEHIHSLLTEARRLHNKKDSLEYELTNNADVDDDDDVYTKQIEMLQDYHIRLLQIRSEIEILENPLLRSGIIRQQEQKAVTINNKDTKKNIYWIFEEGQVDQYITFLNEIKTLYPNETIKSASQLANSLETSNGRNIYILNESRHLIRTTGALETGGVLKGLKDRNKTVVTSSIEAVMFDFKGNVTLENLTIEATSAQCGIVIRKGKVTFSNCKIVGDGVSSTHQGIIVLAGAELEIINSEISGFYSAIIGNSEAKIILNDVKIYDVHFGLKIFDYCSVNAEKTTFQNCKEYGISVETDNTLPENEQKSGSFNILNIIPEIKSGPAGFTGENNTKGDVIINQKSKIKPIRDIFGQSVLDKTIFHYENSEEEMDTEVNNTIIENKKSPSPVDV